MNNNFLVIDCETTGLNPWKGSSPFMVGLMEPNGDYTLYKPKTWDNLDLDYVSLCLRLGNPDTIKVGHNIKFDVHHLAKMGVGVQGTLHDTMILTHLWNPTLLSYKLKDLARTLLSANTSTNTTLKDYLKVESKKQGRALTYADVPVTILEPYLVDDLRHTLALYKHIWPMVENHPCLDTELRLIPALIDMERLGIRIDKVHLKVTITESTQALQRLDNAIITLTNNKDFNWRSNKQLRELYHTTLGFPIKHRTKKGSPSFDSESIKDYPNPITDLILGARTTHKLLETYLKPMADSMDSSNRIHPSFRQAGTTTGRLSCAEPNFQNLPRKGISVKGSIMAPPNHIFVFFDYSQIEMRLFAHYSKTDSLINAIINGEDCHDLTAKRLFPITYKDTSNQKALRQIAKTINFAMIYGAGPRKIEEQTTKLFADNNLICDMQSGERLIGLYNKIYPSVKTFLDSIQNEIRSKGFVVDVFGKEYRCPVTESYKACNYLIQGTAAEIMKQGLVRVYEWTNQLTTIRPTLVNTVHDELILEFPNLCLPLYIPIIKQLMENKKDFSLPITVDTQTGVTWATKTPWPSP